MVSQKASIFWAFESGQACSSPRRPVLRKVTMDSNSLAQRGGALGPALIPAPHSGGSIEPERVVSQNPAEVLAALMDFPGSVALAELLEAGSSTVVPNPQAGTLGERLLEDVRARLDSLEPIALRPILGRRAPRTPNVDELLAIVTRHNIATDRTELAVQRLAAELSGPFRDAFSTSLRQAQAHVATLRWEIVHDVRVLGPHADRLERLDAALTRSMQVKMGELYDRMEHAAYLTFVRACAHAVEALDAELSRDTLVSWTDEDGWIERYRERCVRMAKALFGHMRRGLEGLVRAAAHAEET
jgi:hypothetical protein